MRTQAFCLLRRLHGKGQSPGSWSAPAARLRHHGGKPCRLLARMRRSPFAARTCALVICGVPAAGKSTLAAEASGRLGWPVISSDLVRKELAGVSPSQRAGAASYTAAFSRAVYTELGTRAAACVRDEGGVIIDGTFRRCADRAAFTMAFGGAAPVLYAECRAPLPVLLARAADRDRQPTQASDATAAVVAREYGRWQALDEVPAEHRAVISTQQPPAAALDELISLISRDNRERSD